MFYKIGVKLMVNVYILDTIFRYNSSPYNGGVILFLVAPLRGCQGPTRVGAHARKENPHME